nr:ATP-binding cassette domain-containing protein [Janibacter sp. CX7]
MLRSVTCEFPPGCTVLMGPNGAGKTTLFRALLGDMRINSGSVLRGGRPVASSHDWRVLRGDLGWLPQSFGAPDRATVSSIIQYAAWLKRCDVDVERVLSAVGLAGVARSPFGRLSGGQMRRVGIACALVGNPRSILMDEPTVGLDPEQRDDFHRRIRGISTDTSVVISTHLLEDVAAVAQRLVIIHDGAVRFEGTPAGLTGVSAPEVADVREGYLRAIA